MIMIILHDNNIIFVYCCFAFLSFFDGLSTIVHYLLSYNNNNII